MTAAANTTAAKAIPPASLGFSRTHFWVFVYLSATNSFASLYLLETVCLALLSFSSNIFLTLSNFPCPSVAILCDELVTLSASPCALPTGAIGKRVSKDIATAAILDFASAPPATLLRADGSKLCAD